MPRYTEVPTISKVPGVAMVTALIGEEVILECRTDGTPNPTYQWFYNSIPLADTSFAGRSTIDIIGQEMNRNFGVTLTINEVMLGDDGVFNCTASSVIMGTTFSDSYQTELVVHSKLIDSN